MAKSVTVKTQIKELAVIENKPLSVSEEFYDEFELKAKEMLHSACKRAKANQRNTLMARDL